jgi:hypothetical protein
MNQDFATLATPANARRLLLLRRVCKLNIPPAIVALATQDTLSAEAFDPMVCPYHIEKHAITQFLLDCNLRGVIQADYHPIMTPLNLLNVARLANPQRIIIVTERRLVWSAAITALMLSSASIVRSWAALDDVARDTTIIFDPAWEGSGSHYRMQSQPNRQLFNTVREFPKFMIYEQQQGFERLTHWSVWARSLFPGMPHPLTPRLLQNVPSDWQKMSLAAFALFYNVCIFPHLITTPTIVAALEDDYAASRLKSNMSLLTL